MIDRLLLDGLAPGEWHMAVDEAMLEAHRQDLVPGTLRFYRWTGPTLSLGYAQKLAGIDLTACREAGVRVVRRPTGGRAVLHAGELTYAIVDSSLPAGLGPSYRLIAEALSAGLAELGVAGTLRAGEARVGRSPDCFAAATTADLCVEGSKLMGSAQARRAGGVLQHGSLYLSYPRELAVRVLGEVPVSISDLAAVLGGPPAWETVRDALVMGFRRTLAGRFAPGELTGWELERAEKQAAHGLIQAI